MSNVIYKYWVFAGWADGLGALFDLAARCDTLVDATRLADAFLADSSPADAFRAAEGRLPIVPLGNVSQDTPGAYRDDLGNPSTMSGVAHEWAYVVDVETARVVYGSLPAYAIENARNAGLLEADDDDEDSAEEGERG